MTPLIQGRKNDLIDRGEMGLIAEITSHEAVCDGLFTLLDSFDLSNDFITGRRAPSVVRRPPLRTKQRRRGLIAGLRRRPLADGNGNAGRKTGSMLLVMAFWAMAVLDLLTFDAWQRRNVLSYLAGNMADSTE